LQFISQREDYRHYNILKNYLTYLEEKEDVEKKIEEENLSASVFFGINQVVAKKDAVRTSLGLCNDELNAFKKRLKKNLNTLKELKSANQKVFSLVDGDFDLVPLVGCCSSGGGFRAAAANFGFLRGLKAIGLLDAVMYYATLSGSTWTTASWFVQKYEDPTSDDFLEYLKSAMIKSVDVSVKGIQEGFKKLPERLQKETIKWSLEKVEVSQTSPVEKVGYDINEKYGILLGYGFLFNNDNNFGQEVFISGLSEPAKNGTYPIPIFAAVVDRPETTLKQEWLEFTPFEIGSTYLK
jgi:hypothetical protein